MQTSKLRTESQKNRIQELDGLRGLAILLVMMCHYIGDARVENVSTATRYFLRLMSFGWCGVDLFFVLSGFLIGSILLEAKNSPSYYRTFYLRRIYRIFPLYYLWILLFLIGITVSQFVFAQPWVTRDDYLHIPRYVFFLQNLFWSKTLVEFMWFGAMWSLAIEEQFYLCMPLLVRVVSEKTLFRILIAIVLLVPLARLLILHSNRMAYLASFAMPLRADSLGIGVLGALLWRNPDVRVYLQRNPKILNGLLLSFGIMIGALFQSFMRPSSYLAKTVGYPVLAFFFLTLVLLVLSQASSKWAVAARFGPLCWLGTISYCVYIIHEHVLILLSKIFLGSMPRLTDWMSALITILGACLTCMLAAISWRWLENPLIRLGHRHRYYQS